MTRTSSDTVRSGLSFGTAPVGQDSTPGRASLWNPSSLRFALTMSFRPLTTPFLQILSRIASGLSLAVEWALARIR